VVLIDERPAPGGQYFKQPAAGLDLPAGLLADPQFAGGRALIDRAVGAGVNVVRGTVVTAAPPRTVSAVLPGIGLVRFSPRRLVVATGAYERPLPVPGWTQAGVMTTGALQTLLRSYRVVPRQRIVIAGNGPLNLQVALELSRAGAEVVGVAELAPRPGPGRAGDLMRMALASPGLAWQGAATLAALARGRVPVHWDSVLASIERKGDGLVATLSRPGRAAGSPLRLEADIVATGYGFLPSDEILRLLGVEQDFDPVRGQRITRRDEAMATSVEGVHAVGDCCGLGGAPAAQAEGLVAGLAVARALDGSPGPSLLREEGEALSALGRHRAFQAALWSLFAAPRPGLSLATPETIVCRCEEVTLADLQAARDAGAGDIGALKRATRCGMGPCQGRYCADAAAFLLAGDPAGLDAGSFFAPRPPIRPVPLGQFVVEGSHAVPHPLQDAEG
jgi:NADPH-dependent 2,4-dienoyl-CoA reductase/sulfur reductase-like enzyme